MSSHDPIPEDDAPEIPEDDAPEFDSSLSVDQRLAALEHVAESRFDSIEKLIHVLERLILRTRFDSKQDAENAATKVAGEAKRAAKEVKTDIRKEIAHERAEVSKLHATVTSLEGKVLSILESLVVLQRNNLRTMGAGWLVGAVLIYVLSRALGA